MSDQTNAVRTRVSIATRDRDATFPYRNIVNLIFLYIISNEIVNTLYIINFPPNYPTKIIAALLFVQPEIPFTFIKHE